MNIAGLTEAAAFLGVSKQRLHQLQKKNPKFPRPLLTLAATPIWTLQSLEEFRVNWNRKPGRPKKEVIADDAEKADHPGEAPATNSG